MNFSPLTSKTLLPPDVFGFSSFTIYILILIVGIILLFVGKKAFDALSWLFGAYAGFLLTAFLLIRLHPTGVPVILILIIGAVIGGLIFYRVKDVIFGAFFGFFVLFGLYEIGGFSAIYSLIGGAIAFIIALWKKDDVKLILSVIVGSFAVWFSLLGLGLVNVKAEIVSGLLLIAGVGIQMYEESMKNNDVS